MHYIFIIIIVPILLSPGLINTQPSENNGWNYSTWTEEQVVNSYLLKDHDPELRPALESRSKSKVKVLITIILERIIEIDERNQILTTALRINHRWRDESLRWDTLYSNKTLNANESINVKTLSLASKKVWRPDTYVFNNADVNFAGFLQHDYVTLSAQGDIMWFVSARLKTTCRVDINMFPFDEQICEIQFGSWLHRRDELEYEFLPVGVDYRNLSKLPKNLSTCEEARRLHGALDLTYYKDTYWNLQNATVHYEARSTDLFVAWEKGSGSGMSSPADQQFMQPDVVTREVVTIPDQRDFVLRMHIKRRSLYYIWNIILPCMMLSVLTMVTFMTPVESGEKIQLGLSVFLAFSMFMMLISKKIPPTALEIPLIGIYVTSVMTMTALSVVIGVIIMNLESRGDKYLRAPRFLRRFLIENKLLKWLVNVYDIRQIAHISRILKKQESSRKDDHISEQIATIRHYQILVFQCSKLLARLENGIPSCRISKDELSSKASRSGELSPEPVLNSALPSPRKSVVRSVIQESSSTEFSSDEDDYIKYQLDYHDQLVMRRHSSLYKAFDRDNSLDQIQFLQKPLTKMNNFSLEKNKTPWSPKALYDRLINSRKCKKESFIKLNTIHCEGSKLEPPQSVNAQEGREDLNRRGAINSLVEQHEMAVIEWYVISRVLDRIFFILFIIATILLYTIVFCLPMIASHNLIHLDKYKSTC